MKTLIIQDKTQMATYLEQAWDILSQSYSKVAGGLHFKNPQELLETTQRWHLALLGKELLSITVFKKKAGWKLSAMAKSKKNFDFAKESLKHIINLDLSKTWMELSEKAEEFVLKECEGHRYLSHASFASKLLNKDIKVQKDGFHYEREILGFKKAKIIVGTPNFNQASA